MFFLYFLRVDYYEERNLVRIFSHTLLFVNLATSYVPLNGSILSPISLNKLKSLFARSDWQLTWTCLRKALEFIKWVMYLSRIAVNRDGLSNYAYCYTMNRSRFRKQISGTMVLTLIYIRNFNDWHLPASLPLVRHTLLAFLEAIYVQSKCFNGGNSVMFYPFFISICEFFRLAFQFKPPCSLDLLTTFLQSHKHFTNISGWSNILRYMFSSCIN